MFKKKSLYIYIYIYISFFLFVTRKEQEGGSVSDSCAVDLAGVRAPSAEFRFPAVLWLTCFTMKNFDNPYIMWG